MTRNRIRITGEFALLVSLVWFSPAIVFATHFEVSRLATQVNLASSQLADEVLYTRGYSSVHQQADRLSREAGQLVDAISSHRNQSYVRAQFNDVSRRYSSLERAFLRASRHHHDPYLFDAFGHISNLFHRLNSEYYYAFYQQPLSSQPFYYGAPLLTQHPHIVAPAFRGSRGYVTPYNHNWRGVNNFDHLSPMLERQQRHGSNQHRDGNTSNRRQERATETRRRNHYQ
ncbi:MAG: hypothetical protein IIC60_03030 [Proteobacteria bacterium]|nr:hypothetical protein [Pseudomonadota bacterium]